MFAFGIRCQVECDIHAKEFMLSSNFKVKEIVSNLTQY